MDSIISEECVINKDITLLNTTILAYKSIESSSYNNKIIL